METIATDAPLGVDNVEVDEIEPQPDDVTGGPCLVLVVHSAVPSMPGGIAPGNAVPATGFFGAVDLGVAGLELSGSPNSPSPHVSWGPVENSAEHACSWVTTTDRLLREAKAMVGRDILHPIQDS
jgi:hypothetical protein